MATRGTIRCLKAVTVVVSDCVVGPCIIIRRKRPMVGRRSLWLCIPLFTLASADVGMTLSSQPYSYWQGDRTAVHEVNPLGRWLLHMHPLAFGLCVPVEAAMVGILLLAWPTRLCSRFVLALAWLHALGAASWLAHFGPIGCVYAFFFLGVAIYFVGLFWRFEAPVRT